MDGGTGGQPPDPRGYLDKDEGEGLAPGLFGENRKCMHSSS